MGHPEIKLAPAPAPAPAASTGAGIKLTAAQRADLLRGVLIKLTPAQKLALKKALAPRP